MDASVVLAVVVGLLVGAVSALKLIAPRTQTTLDDRVLARLEQILGFVPGYLKEVISNTKADLKAEDKTRGK